MTRARDLASGTFANDLTVDTNTLYVDSTNNRVGIGTSSPSTKLHISGNSNNTAALSDTVTDFALKFDSATTTNYFSNAICFAEGTNVNASISSFDGGSGGAQGLVFGTGASNTERVRIDSSGNVLIGTTSFAAGQDSKMIQPSQIFSSRNTTGSAGHMSFQNPNGGVGSITTSGSSTAFNTSSDYRLKENVTADWDATTRLKQLNPVRFNFIAEPDATVDGFLAHEVQDIVPEAITGTKDAMRDEEYEVTPATGDIYTPAIAATFDEDGNEITEAVDEVVHSSDVERPETLADGQQWRETTPAVMGTRSVPDYQGIDQSKLVPLLVKTIQELEARLTALEAN